MVRTLTFETMRKHEDQRGTLAPFLLGRGNKFVNDGLGAVGGYAALSDYTELGGQLTVFELPGAPSGG